MRAYTYFVMTKTWGDLPLRQEPTESENPEITQIERTAQSEIFQFIKGDIDQALQLFPDNSYAENKMFWSKPATNALKGEVYLWTAKQMGGALLIFKLPLRHWKQFKLRMCLCWITLKMYLIIAIKEMMKS